jgi:hypothetical protein
MFHFSPQRLLQTLFAPMHIVKCLSDYRRGLGLVMAFPDHFQNITTSNYGAIDNSNTLQFTTARAKPFQSTVPLPVVAR